MSISSINTSAQTGLVPQTLLGYSSNGVSAIEITPTSITLGGNLTTTPIYVEVSASTGLTTNRVGGLNVNCDFDMNSNNITNIDTLSSTTGNPMTLSSDDILYLNSANNTTITPSASFIVNASDNVFLTANGDAMTLSADDAITLTSVANGIFLNSGTGDSGTPNIELNATNGTTTAGNILLNSGADITLNATSGGVISLNSGDNVQLSCGENFFVNTNSTTGIVGFTTGDLANSGVVRWNSYPMSMTFFSKWNGAFSYPITGTNNWDIVRTNTISFPTQFLYGTWAVSFSINCWNVGSQPGDKGLAMYFDFFDGNSNTYEGFNYKLGTPYANWFNPSQYFNTAQQPLSITYTDYFDFSNAVNNLELRLWWYGDQYQTQEFNVSTTYTLMTLI